MGIYFFNLQNVQGTILDPDGTDLHDDASAVKHARTVANELMRHREARTRHWRLEVSDSNRKACFELLFAVVDSSLDYLRPEQRSSIEDLCAKSASLYQTIHAVRRTLLEVKATVARSEGLPHVATVDGLRIS